MKIDEAKLTAYALDELPADERASVEAEISNDTSARQHVEVIRQSAQMIEAALKTESLPEMPAKTVRHNWRVVFAVAASVLLVGGIAFQLTAPSLNRAREVAHVSAPSSVPDFIGKSIEPTAPPPVNTNPVVSTPLAAAKPPAASQHDVQLGEKQNYSLVLSGAPPTAATATPSTPMAAAVSTAGTNSTRTEALRTDLYALNPNGRAKEAEAAFGTVNDGLEFRGHGGFNTESYDRITDNAFLDVAGNPLSTFSIDVDTASYSNVRRFLKDGKLPPPDAVRIEELINYFPYDYKYASENDGPFSASVEVAECPWNSSHRLARIGIKAKEIATNERPASNLVFLLDVSGSMNQPNKLPLVKAAMSMLVEKLNERDRVTIVTYAGHSGLVLEPTRGSDKQKILQAIEALQPGGSTNGASGIKLAYEQAQSGMIDNGVNRVILATDGDFNVGITDQGQLTRLIEEKAKSGVFLSVLGFGMGNLKDSTMEKLADKGNGNYAYIDTQNEARKVLVEQMTGTLITVAKDVKIQIEFNPAVASSYRLIGYENRMLAKEDFNDDKKDAGEIGAGHTVTALYEIVPAGEKGDSPKVDGLKYQKKEEKHEPTAQPMSAELMTLKLRYKEPDGEKSKLTEIPVSDGGATFAKASKEFKFTASVAAFGMLLRNSPHKGSATFNGVLEWAEEGIGADASGYRHEFVDLVKQAGNIREH